MNVNYNKFKVNYINNYLRQKNEELLRIYNNLLENDSEFAKLDKHKSDLILQKSQKNDKKLDQEFNKVQNKIQSYIKNKNLFSLSLPNDDEIKLEYAKENSIIQPMIYKKVNIPTLSDLGINEANESFNTLLKAYEFVDTTLLKIKNEKPLIFISSSIRVGKTYLLLYIFNKLIENAIDCQFLTSFELSKIFTNIEFNKTSSSIFDKLIETDYLLIDDLGTEQIKKEITNEFLQNLLDKRSLSGKVTIITSNLSYIKIEKAKELYGERVAARLFDKSTLQIQI